MKHYYILAIAFIGVVLFGFNANAEEIYLENFNLVDNTCWAHDNTTGLDTCGANYADYQIGTAYWIAQDIGFAFLPSSYRNSWSISSVNTYIVKGSGGSTGTMTSTGYLLDQAQFDVLKATNNIPDALATSTSNGLDVTATETFTFSPAYLANSTNGFPKYFVVRFTGVLNPSNVQFRLASDSNYGLGGGFSFLINAWSDDIKPIDSDLDLMLELYTDDTQLVVTSPSHFEIVNNNFSLAGTCPGDVNYAIHNEATIASSTSAAYGFADCDTNTFFNTIGGLPENGVWYITATTTYSYYLRTFVFYDDSVDAIDDTLQDALDDVRGNIENSEGCPIPYLNWNPCAAVAGLILSTASSTRGLTQTVYEITRTTKPYSYVPQIIDSFTTANDTPSSTIATTTFAIASTTVAGGFDFAWNVNIGNMIDDIIPESVWNSLRPIFVVVLYLAFGYYLFFRFLRSA